MGVLQRRHLNPLCSLCLESISRSMAPLALLFALVCRVLHLPKAFAVSIVRTERTFEPPPPPPKTDPMHEHHSQELPHQHRLHAPITKDIPKKKNYLSESPSPSRSHDDHAGFHPEHKNESHEDSSKKGHPNTKRDRIFHLHF